MSKYIAFQKYSTCSKIIHKHSLNLVENLSKKFNTLFFIKITSYTSYIRAYPKSETEIFGWDPGTLEPKVGSWGWSIV